MQIDRSRYQEHWLETSDGQLLCALINGDVGWLMYLRENGDAGFSSRNPLYDGPPDAEIEYHLNNGQRDLYPVSWAYPLEMINRAMAYFVDQEKPPPFIVWNNDSEDGEVIGHEGTT